ncbi:MAG: hypothetical protein LBG80_09855 [Bacteroidales bacterium]|jgi:hypothetical protein|nr:hypothetical protein [Bacteroidales bacterium]
MAKSFNQFDIVSLLRNIDFLVGYKGDNGEEIRISGATLASLFTGQAGSSVQIQFSANAENWHYPAMEGDQYVKFKSGNDAWSSALKFVGAKGDTGTGLTIMGTFETLEDLQAGVANKQQGDMYNVGSEAPYNIYMWDENGVAGSWVNLGSLKGERGCVIYRYLWGLPAVVGNGYVITNPETLIPQGITPKLNDFVLGSNNTLGIVNKLRYDENPQKIEVKTILVLKGETGASAYQTWLNAGNSGTEEDFLNSLKGERGTAIYKINTDLQNVGINSAIANYPPLVSSGVKLKVDDILLGNNNILAKVVTLYEESPNTVQYISYLNIKGTDGLSAYQIWLATGMQGTEQDFLNSLKGEGTDILTGVEPGSILWIDSQRNPRWLKGNQTISDTETPGEVEISSYARKYTILNTSGYTSFNIKMLYDFAELEDMTIVIFNTSELGIMAKLDFTGNFIGILQSDSHITEGMHIEAGRPIFLTLSPFKKGAVRMVMIISTEPVAPQTEV